MDNYTVSYNYIIRRCGSGPVSGSEEISDGNARNFTLTGLEEDSDYTITLTANSAVGRFTSSQITTTTTTAGLSLQKHNCCFSKIKLVLVMNLRYN